MIGRSYFCWWNEVAPSAAVVRTTPLKSVETVEMKIQCVSLIEAKQTQQNFVIQRAFK